jgi:O-antigen ligase
LLENKNQLNSKKVPQWLNMLVLVSGGLLIVGLFVSRAFMSIGMAGLAIPFFAINLRENLRFARTSLLFWSSIVLILSYFLTVFYSEDMGYFSHRMQLKLSLLLFPLMGIGMRKFPTSTFRILLYFLLLCIALESIGALINYALHFEKITRAYIAGQVIPLPLKMNHIRFSLMMASAVFIGAYLLWDNRTFFHKKTERIFLFAVCIINGIFLHILSVRSGLLAFYLGNGVLILFYMVNKKKYLHGVLMLLSMMILSVVLYFTVPTIYNKINYTVRDVSRFFNGENSISYSDGNRLLSMKIALEIGKESPWLGIGLGDVENKMFAYYELHHPEMPKEQRLIPHSQFLYCWLAAGVMGVLCLLMLIIVPYCQQHLRLSLLPILIHTVYVSSFLSEATLENQLGSISYGFLFWICAAYASHEKTINAENLQ